MKQLKQEVREGEGGREGERGREREGGGEEREKKGRKAFVAIVYLQTH